MTQLSFEDPQNLPWLISFDEYVEGRGYQGHTELSLRPGVSNSSTAVNEAVSWSLTKESGQITQNYTLASVSVNGGESQARLVVDLPDAQWANELGTGVLYKAKASGSMDYLGDDPTQYENSYQQVNAKGTYDLAPVMNFLDFVNNSSDEDFASELSDYLDVDDFAKYLATQCLLSNSDAMDGPGNNYYLWYDTEEERFTVLSWDLNMTLGIGMGGGAPRGGATDTVGDPGAADATGSTGGENAENNSAPSEKSTSSTPTSVPPSSAPAEPTDAGNPTDTADAAGSIPGDPSSQPPGNVPGGGGAPGGIPGAPGMGRMPGGMPPGGMAPGGMAPGNMPGGIPPRGVPGDVPANPGDTSSESAGDSETVTEVNSPRGGVTSGSVKLVNAAARGKVDVVAQQSEPTPSQSEPTPETTANAPEKPSASDQAVNEPMVPSQGNFPGGSRPRWCVWGSW